MKSGISLLLRIVVCALLSPLFSKAQIVQSYCSGPASLQSQYLEDAWYVAYETLLKHDSANFSNSIPIDPAVKDQVLSAILGVYNADLAARDTVIQMFDIHQHRTLDLHRIELYVDTLFPWAREFAFGNVAATGNYYVDSLSTLYGFELENVIWGPVWVTDWNAIVRIKVPDYVHTNLLAQVMTGFSGVKFANAYTLGGDGNRIFYTPRDTFAELSFRFGWEDCPSGCLFQREWLFRVYNDCKVEFVASYGDPLSASPTKGPIDPAPVRVFPNPASGQITFDVQEADRDLPAEFLDVQGRQVFSWSTLPRRAEVSALTPGMYYLRIWKPGNPIVVKVAVE